MNTNITKIKPEIGFCTNNGRDHWTLTLSIPHPGDFADGYYEMRVRINGCEDTKKLFHVNRAEHDDLELVSKAGYEQRRMDIAVNEPIQCETHENMTVEELEKTDYFDHEDETGWRCAECKRVALNHADAVLADKCRVMEKVEMEIADHLRNTWNAFALLFNPSWTF